MSTKSLISLLWSILLYSYTTTHLFIQLDIQNWTFLFFQPGNISQNGDLLTFFVFCSVGYISWRVLLSIEKCLCLKCLIDIANLYAYQQCMKFPGIPHPCYDTFHFNHSSGCIISLTVVLIYIPLMISEVSYLFICLLSVWKSSFAKCLLKSFAQFSIELFFS